MKNAWVLICVSQMMTLLNVVQAVDMTRKNDFWDPTSYVAPTPSEQTAVTAGPIAEYSPVVVVSDVLFVLDTSPLGLMLLVK